MGLGDAVLILRVRDGDGEAFDMLCGRHRGAASRLARHLVPGRAEAETAVAGAFAAVLEILRQGGGPSDAFRPFLLTTLRRTAAGLRDEDGESLDPDVPFVDPALAGVERRPMAQAYLSLPERWRAVLWHTAVEGESPARVQPVFGLGVEGVAALAHRAREGLRQAYLQLRLAEALPPECRPVLDGIRVYLRGAVTARDRIRVREHLRGCARCRTAAADLKDVDGRLGDVAALVLGTAASSYLASKKLGRTVSALPLLWGRSSSGRRRRLLGAGALAVLVSAGLLAWPGGHRPVPSAPGGSGPPAAAGPERRERPRPGAGPGSSALAEPVVRAPMRSRSAVLRAEIEPAGVLLPGRAGVVVLTVRNVGAVPSQEVVAEVALPRGVTPEKGHPGQPGRGWSCRPGGRAVRCVHGSLPPGGRSWTHLPVSVAGDAPPGGAPTVTLGAPGTDARASAGVSPFGLPARFVTEGRTRATAVGNVLLSCSEEEPECARARRRKGVRLDNDQWEMSRLDLDATPSTRSSSPAALALPGRVRWAGLYWSGVAGRQRYTARLRGPSGGYRTVEASWSERVSLPGHEVYQAFAEVTAQVRRGGAGRWWVADIPARTGPGGYAGWSLVVVCDDPGAEFGRTMVLDGARPVGVDGTTRVRVPVGGLLRAGATARFGMLAWEGDAAVAGDRVLLDGRPLSAPNAFTGAVAGERGSLAFGMDLVGYEAKIQEKPVLEVVSSADASVVGLITVTAPLRS